MAYELYHNFSQANQNSGLNLQHTFLHFFQKCKTLRNFYALLYLHYTATAIYIVGSSGYSW